MQVYIYNRAWGTSWQILGQILAMTQLCLSEQISNMVNMFWFCFLFIISYSNIYSTFSVFCGSAGIFCYVPTAFVCVLYYMDYLNYIVTYPASFYQFVLPIMSAGGLLIHPPSGLPHPMKQCCQSRPGDSKLPQQKPNDGTLSGLQHLH